MSEKASNIKKNRETPEDFYTTQHPFTSYQARLLYTPTLHAKKPIAFGMNVAYRLMWMAAPESPSDAN